MRKLLGRCLLACIPSMLVAGSVAAQGTLRAGDVQIVAGSTAAVPLTLELSADVGVQNLGFTMKVAPRDGAPAVSEPLAFAGAEAIPKEDLSAASGSDTLAVGWISDFDPKLKGAVALGVLRVPIPAGAQADQAYDVQLLTLSASPDGETKLLLETQGGTIQVRGDR